MARRRMPVATSKRSAVAAVADGATTRWPSNGSWPKSIARGIAVEWQHVRPEWVPKKWAKSISFPLGAAGILGRSLVFLWTGFEVGNFY